MPIDITIDSGDGDEIIVRTDDDISISTQTEEADTELTDGGWLTYDDSEVWDHINAIEAKEPTWDGKMDHIDPLNNLEIEDILV